MNYIALFLFNLPYKLHISISIQSIHNQNNIWLYHLFQIQFHNINQLFYWFHGQTIYKMHYHNHTAFIILLGYIARIIATIIPYSPSASAKIKISTIPTNTASCCAFARTPASPTTPIARPAPSALRPQQNPDAMCLNPSFQ